MDSCVYWLMVPALVVFYLCVCCVSLLFFPFFLSVSYLCLCPLVLAAPFLFLMWSQFYLSFSPFFECSFSCVLHDCLHLLFTFNLFFFQPYHKWPVMWLAHLYPFFLYSLISLFLIFIFGKCSVTHCLFTIFKMCYTYGPLIILYDRQSKQASFTKFIVNKHWILISLITLWFKFLSSVHFLFGHKQ